MRLLLAKFLLVIAYSFVLAHTLVPHHHDDPPEAIQSHHDNGKDHNIFSFGQIDNIFVSSQKEVVKKNDCILKPALISGFFKKIKARYCGLPGRVYLKSIASG